MSKSPDFNWLAKYYDFLAGLIYGESLQKSQRYFLNSIPAGASVLIIGGGTGETLKRLLDMNPDCRVWYIEASSKMLSLARKKIAPQDLGRVRFIHGTEASPVENILFDAIITNFFLDMFPDNGVLNICRIFCPRLKSGGVWLVSDFVDGGKWWHRSMLWIMYRFFVLTCGIESRKLPSWEIQLASAGLKEVKSVFFFGGFIKTSMYTKQING